MDFLKIRKKAKERAQARADAEGEPRARRPDPAPAAPPAEAPVVTDADVLEGALAARLEGLPAAEAPAPAAPPGDDARFTTWRPGSGAPPALAEPEPAGEVAPRLEDFAFVVRPGVVPAAPEPLPPRPAPAAPPPALEAPAPVDPLDEFFFREDEAGPALPEVASAAAEPEAEPVILAREEFLTFLLGAEEYAVAIERVREVVRAPPITEVPRAPAHILGVVTVRGEVVAVVDPRRRLGLPHPRPADGEGKIVIVDAGDGPCGLHVDRVASVVRLRPGSIEPCPQGIAGQRAEFLAGIGREGDRLFTVLDLGAVLRRAPARPEGAGRRADA